MSLGVPWEIGFFSHDIEASRARLSKSLGVTFREIMPAHVLHIEDPEPGELKFNFTVSLDGPPYLEIVDAVEGSGLHNPEQPDGLHHIGVWVSDFHEHYRRLTAAGVRSLARAYDDSTDPPTLLTWFNEPADLAGVCYEFFDDRFRPALDAWLRSPDGTPHPMTMAEGFSGAVQ